MSVPNTLLALLAAQPTHGYGLKTAFEGATDGRWPLNVGQVYTTLARLERDGLVAAVGTTQDDRKARWRITRAGRETLERWYRETTVEPAPRDEMILRVLVALSTDYDEVQGLIDRQRDVFMRLLQELAHRRRDLGVEASLATRLFLDSQMLRLEADLRWLDRCTERLEADVTRGATHAPPDRSASRSS